jgi:hypothetical protein
MFQSVPLTAEQAKTAVVAVNTSAGAALFSALAGYIPLVVAIIPAVWYAIQIWETKTVQKHIRLWKIRRRQRRAEKIAHKLLAVVPSAPAAAQIIQTTAEHREAVATGLAAAVEAPHHADEPAA